jgi:methylmalonyl-CoA mutase
MNTLDTWEKAAVELLKGKALSSLSSTVDGLTLEPLYTEASPAGGRAQVPASWATWVRVRSQAEAEHAVALGARHLWVAYGVTVVAPDGVTIHPHAAHLDRASADVLRSDQPLVLSTRAWCRAGAEAAQELGLLLATTVDGLRACEAVGVDLGQALGRTVIRLATGRDILGTVAKFRATRLVFSKLRAACGLPPAPLELHAVTGVTTLATRDPWNNLVRATFETIGAALGGANAITVTPFDLGLGDSELGRRLAVTLPTVLADEAHVTSSAAEGAYAIEAATQTLVRLAWAEFQRIEALGGLSAAQADIVSRLDRQRDARHKALARRKTVVVGVNDFAPIGDAAPELLPGGFREAGSWEALARSAITGGATAVLARLGDSRAHAARAEYTTRLLQAAGFVVHDVEVDELEAARAAFVQSGAQGVVLCGADDEYAARIDVLKGAVATVTAPGAAFEGAQFVLLAGAPKDREDGLRARGVTDFVFISADVLGVLARIVHTLEVSR